MHPLDYFFVNRIFYHCEIYLIILNIFRKYLPFFGKILFSFGETVIKYLLISYLLNDSSSLNPNP